MVVGQNCLWLSEEDRFQRSLKKNDRSTDNTKNGPVFYILQTLTKAFSENTHKKETGDAVGQKFQIQTNKSQEIF